MNQKELKSTIRYILDNLDESRKVKNRAFDIRKKLIDLTLEENIISEQDFYKISSVLSPQSRSPMWQNYFIKKHGCEKISKDENRGDLKMNGKYYEYKCSGYNQSNDVNIVQIRLWQDCSYIIQSISDDIATTFVLTHEEMMSEVKTIKASSAHGTKEALKDNKNKELRMTLKKDSVHWDRWINNYLKREADFFQS